MATQGDSNVKRDEDDENEDDEEEVDETSYKTVKDAVLFAIDVSSSMLQQHEPQDPSKDASTDSATLAALKCAYQLMQQRIISNPKDMMGILLFGTRQTKFQDDDNDGAGSSSTGSFPYPHCYLLSDLDVPAAADVKRIRSLIEDEQVSRDLLLPSDEQVAMSNVLFAANQIFTTRAPNFISRRLFLVTDNDNPHAHAKDMKNSAAVRARDLYDLGVTIELFPISQPGRGFDRGKFYDDIVYRPPSDPEAPAPLVSVAKTSSNDGISLLQSLVTAVHSKAVPKRALFSNIPLEFSPDLRISVKGFVIFKRQTPARSCYVWLDGEVPQIAVGNTTRLADDTARAVDKAEIKKAYKFGGSQVLFTPEELVQLRTFGGEPAIRIIGFKPMEMLPVWANLRPSTFIYPSEEGYVGSTRTFAALQQSLLKKEMMAIAHYVARRNATPIIAAILPGPEEVDVETGEQVIPPGLWICPLPYADDIRQNPDFPQMIKAPESVIDKMRIVIQQLQLPKAVYDPSRYPNPALQWHYRILQALALDDDLPEKPEDKTIPRYRQVDKRAGGYVIDWGHELEAEYQKWQQQHGSTAIIPTKRVKQESEGAAPKKVKTESDAMQEVVVSDDKVRDLYDKNKLSSLKVAELKDWLKNKGQKPQSKKDDLLAQVEMFLEYKK